MPRPSTSAGHPDNLDRFRVVMHEKVDHATESYTFTAVAPLCPSGTFADHVTVLGSNNAGTVIRWLVHTTYTCDDGSGTFFAVKHLVRHQGVNSAWNVGWVEYAGGTGAYGTLTGHGFDYGASANGQGAGTTWGHIQLTPAE